MSGSEGESGLGHESEPADSCASTTSAGVVVSSVVAASSQSAYDEKLVSSKHQKATVKKEKSPNEKKKPVKPAVKYLCPHCDHETTNIVKHFSHKRLHRELNNNNSFKCHLCAYESKIKGGLQRHVKRVHTKERPFTCSVCDFRAVDKPSMAKHIISKHKQDLGPDLAMYIDCAQSNKFIDEEICGYSPTHGSKSDAAELNESMAIEKDGAKTNENLSPREEDTIDLKEEEGKVNFQKTKNLSVCNIKAQTSEKTAKTNERPCVQKEKLTNSVRKDCSVRKSRKKASSSYRNLYSTPEYREMRARKLTCEFCRKQCGSQRSLLSHFNEHKNENIFCPICHMFIVDPDCRQAHIENHLNTTNRYTCATCLSTFAESSEVIAHQQRDHRKSINVIMECMFCSFSSRSQERFSRHMTRCHMFGSDGPKHNAFDVSKMKEFVINYERSKIKNNIKTELLSDEHEEKYESSFAVEANKQEQHETEGLGSGSAPLDDQISLGDLEDELDSSFFDISAHMNDSLDNFQELLNESERLEAIKPSHGKNQVDQNCAVTIGNEEKDDESCEPGALLPSDKAGGVDRAAIDQMSVNSLRLTSSLGRKLVKSSVESSGRGFDGEVMDIPINEFHVPFELLKESGAFNDPCQQQQRQKQKLENSIHLSRISSIANTWCDKKASISAKNLQKARQRKTPKSQVHQSRIPSPDSTSGTK